ncbi:hypothetical protein KBT16_20630 [Nostoc sp. CCCryo 231-06]|nr:hypothetical protein [Nostoc sp. CCCryo 231-06]
MREFERSRSVSYTSECSDDTLYVSGNKSFLGPYLNFPRYVDNALQALATFSNSTKYQYLVVSQARFEGL